MSPCACCGISYDLINKARYHVVSRKVTELTLRDTIISSEQYLREFITRDSPNKADEALVKDCVTGITRGLTQSPRSLPLLVDGFYARSTE